MSPLPKPILVKKKQDARIRQHVIRLGLSLFVLLTTTTNTLARTQPQWKRQLSQNNIAIQQVPATKTIEPGKPIERELAGGEAHSYQLTLGAGQYAQLEVDQRRINVAVSVFASDGKKLFEADMFRIGEVETVSLIAEHPEIYRLEIRSSDKTAPGGRYGVVLSLVDEQGRPQNGFLRLYDIYNLKLQADLVVLSACQTGLGKDIKGEGLVGLTRGFMYAGAPRVVSSLWQIEDRASAELMRRFYEAMLARHLPPAVALRTAQVSMWKDKRWREFYYWAAFTIQGDWK